MKIMYKRKDDRSNICIVFASTSFMLPVSMQMALDLLKKNIMCATVH
jgi:hypothetical protein